LLPSTPLPSLRTHDWTMTPTIIVRAEETLKAIENTLKRRKDTSQILKEKEQHMLSGEDYQRIEVNLNKKQFL
jgi:hypothetical protein